jgi:hypothetical protein
VLGRDGELGLFRTALGAPEPRFTVLHVHGPGGVGKTALLRAFAVRPVDQRCLSLTLRGMSV